MEYESSPCNATQDKVCNRCGIKCSVGQYIGGYCEAYKNITCLSCIKRCDVGYFLTSAVCDGSSTVDNVLKGCKACLKNCSAGYYLSAMCMGNETRPNECRRCAADVMTAKCKPEQYYGGCSGYNNTRCLDIPLCPEGQYRYGKTSLTPGVCKPCANCSAVGLNVSRVCGRFEDTVCDGMPCGPSMACNGTFDTKFFCDYFTGNASTTKCGLCPNGYDSTGQYCTECPEGKTCDRRGQLACEGQCGAFRVSECDPDLGFARCGVQCDYENTDGSKIVTRGSYRATNMDPGCVTYFQCAAGYYKRFGTAGTVQCEPCFGNPPTHGAWATPGLSVNDGWSCLWECPGWLSILNGNRSGCELLDWRAVDEGMWNAAGYYGDQDGIMYSTCGPGKTSEAGAAAEYDGCLDCPGLPSGATWSAGGVECEWRCTRAWEVAKGGACVQASVGVGTQCHKEGLHKADGMGDACAITGYPWNRPGFSKEGWVFSVLVPTTTSTLAATSSTSTTLTFQSATTTSTTYTTPASVVTTTTTIKQNSTTSTPASVVTTTTTIKQNSTTSTTASVVTTTATSKSNSTTSTTPASVVTTIATSKSNSTTSTTAASVVTTTATSKQNSTTSTPASVVTTTTTSTAKASTTSTPVITSSSTSTTSSKISPTSTPSPATVWDSTFLLQQTEVNGLVLKSWSLPYGLRGRHRVDVIRNQVTRSWSVDGPICSMTHAWMGGYEFMLGAVCNQSFLVYLNLSAPAPKLGVLIGNGTRGWANGFKSQARFQSELHVTRGARNDTLFVLDRWNCLLREVVIGGEPGGYLTRVYTVYGVDYKLKIANLKEPKCYGPGSLASPRRFWPLRDQWVAFAVDDGLYQFDMGTREVVLMGLEATDFQAESVARVTSPGVFTVQLEFWDGSAQNVKALERPCPDDTTSLAGGDCTVACKLGEGHFVDPVSGGCTPCVQLQCGAGQEFVGCNRTRQGYCRDCEFYHDSGKVFIQSGTCLEMFMRLVPPCKAGYYKSANGNYCSQCPLRTSTLLDGAGRVEQCKCVPGLARRNGGCAGEFLYDLEGPATIGSQLACETVCASTTSLPRNARWTGDSRRVCAWECNIGFYHDTQAGWDDKCRACMDTNYSAVFTTRGDYDAPMSCETA